MLNEELERIRELLRPVFCRTGVIRAVVFGSMAAGKESRRSDLDLMIVKESEDRFFDRFDEFAEIYQLVKGRAVDLLIYTPEELERISHRPFIRRILREGKVLYEH